MFRKPIVHSGLKAYRVVCGQTQSEVNTKAALQEAIWAERWQKKLNADRTRDSRTKKLQQRNLNTEQTTAAKALALEQTRELESERESLEKLLQTALGRDARPNWEKKKDKSTFDVAKPLQPKADPVPSEPDPTAPRFNAVPFLPTFSLLDKLISSRREKKVAEASEIDAQAQSNLLEELESERASWRAEVKRHVQFTADLKAAYEEDVRKWEIRKKLFNTNRDTLNSWIDLTKASYLAGDEKVIISYIEDVLSQSEYPDNFPKEHRLEYIGSTKTLVLDYELPNQTALPSVKEIKYFASRSEFQEVPISEAWVKRPSTRSYIKFHSERCMNSSNLTT